MASRSRAKRGKRRGVLVGIVLGALLSAASIWLLWQATRPPAEDAVHLPNPLSPRGGDLPRESIDAAERARLDELLRERAGEEGDGARGSR